MGEYYIAVFVSKNHAVELHHILSRKGHNYELISTPCKISSGCSYSIKFNHLYSAKPITEAAKEYKKTVKDIYKIYRVNGKLMTEKITDSSAL